MRSLFLIGGSELFESLERGKLPSQRQLFDDFSPATQDRVFYNRLARLILDTNGTESAVNAYLGGLASLGTARPLGDRYSILELGELVVGAYLL